MTERLFYVFFGVDDAGIASHGATVCRLALLHFLYDTLVNGVALLRGSGMLEDFLICI